jgi:hypothetical protein
MSVHELLEQRHKEYAQALQRARRAEKARSEAEERVKKLEAEMADAEMHDRVVLGDALIDRGKAPAAQAPKMRAKLDRAREEFEALGYAAERAHRLVEEVPATNRAGWLAEASRNFQRIRQQYAGALEEAFRLRAELGAELELISYLAGAEAHHLPHELHVAISGVDGLQKSVPATDVLEALRDEATLLEFQQLTTRLEG